MKAALTLAFHKEAGFLHSAIKKPSTTIDTPNGEVQEQLTCAAKSRRVVDTKREVCSRLPIRRQKRNALTSQTRDSFNKEKQENPLSVKQDYYSNY